MKKQYVNSVSILFAMLCLAFTACNGMLTGGDTGTVLEAELPVQLMEKASLRLMRVIPLSPLRMKRELN